MLGCFPSHDRQDDTDLDVMQLELSIEELTHTFN